jgi:hypothetical protein
VVRGPACRSAPGAVTAALALCHAPDRRAPAAGWGDGVIFADQPLLDLLTALWRMDAVLGAGQDKDVLAHLHAADAEFPRPAAESTPTGQAWEDPLRPAMPLPGSGLGRPRGRRRRGRAPGSAGTAGGRIRGCGRWGACSSMPSAWPAPPAGCAKGCFGR